MTNIFLNGKAPPYMESRDPDRLSTEQIARAATSLTYSALRVAAAGFFSLYQSLGYSPAEAVEVLSDTMNLKEQVAGNKDGISHEQA